MPAGINATGGVPGGPSDVTTGSDAPPSEAQKRRDVDNAAEAESAAAQDQMDTMATSSLSGTTAVHDDIHDEQEGIPRSSEDTLQEHAADREEHDDM